MRYQSKPITPVDAVRWNGDNLEEVQEICPEIDSGGGAILWVPSPGFALYINEYIMKNVAGGTYTKLNADVFVGLYMPQSEVTANPTIPEN